MGGKYLSYASSVGEINRPGRWHGKRNLEKSTQVCCMAVFVEIPRYLLLPLSC